MDEKKKALLKKLEYFTYIEGQREVFLKAVEYDALKIAVIFDPFNTQARGKRLKEIEQSYSKKDFPKFLEIANGIYDILSGMLDDFGDHLGELYMGFMGQNKSSGQFFTPYNVSKFMAKITLDGRIKDEEIVSLNEPTCGSGGMVVAAADIWTENGFNYTNNALVVASDIDRNCALMSYLQISFLGMPAVVQWKDTLTQKTYETFLTPAFALQYNKFKCEYDKLGKQNQM